MFNILDTLAEEALILMCMSYDCYVAICLPLHYPIYMNRRVCVLMILGFWAMGAVNSCAYTVYVLHIPYCRSRAIDHFYCDIPAMLTLACGDNSVFEYIVLFSSIIFLLFPLLVILGSYGKVLLAVYCMRSREGRKKAYSTCSTHLTVVTLYYVPFVFTYLCPKCLLSPAVDKLVAVFYTILTPVLNPVIYSLRNKEVLGALRRVAGRFLSTTMAWRKVRLEIIHCAPPTDRHQSLRLKCAAESWGEIVGFRPPTGDPAAACGERMLKSTVACGTWGGLATGRGARTRDLCPG
ncbi:olfactory receptor 2L3-like [Fukomys damarensis]|uniref:olfactory receptor 2L3-like n=1 Tax=Fukomys damarensis TaxID=885580 RepID=UPI00053F5565|nr:olfactory receptor 2L3-like [Fukomys damarensis]